MGRLVVAAAVAAWAIPVSFLVNRIVPDPYMDEIFHIPQVQRYCAGDFRSWDPMITTPPGLYYVSLAYAALLFPGTSFSREVHSFSDVCLTPILRSINGALAIICAVLIYDILVHLNPAVNKRGATMRTFIIAMYPVHWFFTFMYYTDVASVTMVLAMYLAALKSHFWISSIFGALSLLIRQTNVVWILFVAATIAIEHTKALHKEQNVHSEGDRQTGESHSENSNLRLRRHILKKSSKTQSDFRKKQSAFSNDNAGFPGELLEVFLKLWKFKWKMLLAFAPFVLIIISFMSFVIWNGGIVLGAKDAHVVSPHFAQLLYFGLASAAAAAPMHFNMSQAVHIFKSFLRSKLKNSLMLLVSLLTGLGAVHFFSIAHPYLLADNRHYTFYIWRKIVNFHWAARYCLVPLYIYSWCSIFSILGKSQTRTWRLIFFVACSAVLVPAPLIEFRYYTLPFFLLILHSRIDDNISWLLVGALFLIVNVFTMIMFLFHPFRWNHELGIQRFIW